jgi:molybdopterin-guanine dinucleotide biosynthesis protein A
MGTDKATLAVDGVTLLERTLSGVPADVDVVVAGPSAGVGELGRQRVTFAQEEPPGGGPVAGLDAALTHVETPVVVVLATDLPFVGVAPQALATLLVERAGTADAVDAVLLADASGRPQQLCAAYRADPLRSASAAGGSVAGASVHGVVARLTVLVASVRPASDGPAADPTWDIDTPDDLARMEKLLQGTSEPEGPDAGTSKRTDR